MRFLIRMSIARQEALRILEAMHSMVLHPGSLRLEIQKSSLKKQKKLRLK